MRTAFYTLATAFVVMWAEVSLAPLLLAQSRVIPMPKNCLVAAAVFQADYELGKHKIWSRIVRVAWNPRGDGHAFCVYSLRNGEVWTYDSVHGSMPLNTTSRDLRSIYEALSARYGHRLYSAQWLD